MRREIWSQHWWVSYDEYVAWGEYMDTLKKVQKNLIFYSWDFIFFCMSFSILFFISEIRRLDPWGLFAIPLSMNVRYQAFDSALYIIPRINSLLRNIHPYGSDDNPQFLLAQSLRIFAPFICISYSVYVIGLFLSFLSFLDSRFHSFTDTRKFISTALMTISQIFFILLWSLILWSFSTVSHRISFFISSAWGHSENGIFFRFSCIMQCIYLYRNICQTFLELLYKNYFVYWDFASGTPVYDWI